MIEPEPASRPSPERSPGIRLQEGRDFRAPDLAQVLGPAPTLLVFLRHFG